jgi:hypothetical protein
MLCADSLPLTGTTWFEGADSRQRCTKGKFLEIFGGKKKKKKELKKQYLVWMQFSQAHIPYQIQNLHTNSPFGWVSLRQLGYFDPRAIHPPRYVQVHEEPLTKCGRM